MSVRYLGAALVAAILAIQTIAPASAQMGPPQDRYIVVLNDGIDFPDAVAAEVAARVGGRVGYVYETALRGFSITMPRAARAGIAREPRVAYVEEDRPVSIVAQTLPTGIQRIFADRNNSIGIDALDDERVDVDVAVLDTGIDREHPDLNVVGGANCLQSVGNGPPWARSYVCDPDASGDDDHYHGTHVAGTIAALDNGIGVVGVAPGARLWAVKVLDSSGSGYVSGIVAGIDWVVAQGNIEVLNMSLGGSGVNTSYETAIDAAVENGVVVVVAAGNSDVDANNYSPAYVPSAITVSALADFDGEPGGSGSPTCRSDQDDTLADFSNWGSAIDIAAPGVCILSTYPIERGAYGTISGTSMAAPHVAGAAALLASGADGPETGSDVQGIRDALVNSGNFGWTDDSDDGTQEPLLDVSATATFGPVFVATGGEETGANSAPTADFTYGDCIAGETCSFDASGSTDGDGTITSYEWDFGDGTTTTGVTVEHSFPSEGTFSVTLTVTDNDGAKDSIAQDVTVSSSGELGGLEASSTNEGRTWTAIVSTTDGNNLTGEWSYGAAPCPGSGDTCSLSEIPKKESSVTFSSSNGYGDITVFKP